MLTQTNPEIVSLSVRATARTNLGDLVEVIFKSPSRPRTITYLGYVANRPADKAEVTIITHKLGGEQLLTMQPTYTIQTVSQIAHDTLPDDSVCEVLMTPADLIFDPSSSDYSIRRAEVQLPEQAHNQR